MGDMRVRSLRPSAFARAARACAMAVVWAAMAAPAAAHHAADGGPTSGLSIPSLTHGEMRVVAAERGAILSLADRQFQTDPTFRRLRNFIALQHYSCLYELLPGSLSDEDSPFNECAHADLAAVRALLEHMVLMPAAEPSARRLRGEVERGIAAEDADPVLCRFSDEPFNTADVIAPNWRRVPTHLPTALTLIGTLLLAASGALLIRRALPPPRTRGRERRPLTGRGGSRPFFATWRPR